MRSFVKWRFTLETVIGWFHGLTLKLQGFQLLAKISISEALDLDIGVIGQHVF